MTDSVEDMVGRLVADCAKRHDDLGRMQRQMTEVTAEVTAPRNLMTAVVGPGGELKELRFNNREYRDMGPKDLAQVILDTVNKARDDVRRQTAQHLAPFLGGAEMPNVFDKDFEWSSLMPKTLFGETSAFAAPEPKQER